MLDHKFEQNVYHTLPMMFLVLSCIIMDMAVDQSDHGQLSTVIEQKSGTFPR